MDRTTIDLWVGVFVALGVAALLGLAIKAGNLTSSKLGDTYSVSAKFENIGSLKPRAPVKSAGVVVGRVRGISFDTQVYKAVVKLDIDERYRFPKDSFASIFTSGLLGEQYISIEAGGDDAVIKNGEQFQHTQDAVVLEKLISQLLFNKASEGKDKSSQTPNAAKPPATKPKMPLGLGEAL